MMDDIKVGDRRRWKRGINVHEVTAVAPWGVEIEWEDNTREARHRSEYDDFTEPVPAAPTFERGDVVTLEWKLNPFVVTTSPDSQGACRLDSVDGHIIAHINELTPTGHKVATVDEGVWFVITDTGKPINFHDRDQAERVIENGVTTATTIATIRDGRIVEPWIDDDGVEHLVPGLSEPRT